jgi:hypothetical protein
VRELLAFLQVNELWFFLLDGAIFIVYLRRLLLSLAKSRKVEFGLEREQARRQVAGALAIMSIAGILGAVVFSMNTFLTPNLASISFLSTPTLNPLATATATLAAPQITPTSQLGFAPTLQLLQVEGCLAGKIEWTYPTPGSDVYGSVILKGTIDVPNIGFYKYEYSQAGSDNWLTIAAGNSIRNDQELGGAWDTTQLVPGDYRLRLVVADFQNQVLPACVIPIRIIPVPEE